ncbi:MAG: TonB-dependent receptor [Bacteroidaceae bacterium]|nr:TonB-dependent receptor [Bacteroidaceae bacterium]
MQVRTLLLLGTCAASISLQAETQNEGIQDTTRMSEVVVTGTRDATDQRHLPFTVTSISNEKLNENYRSSVIPTVVEQTPGLFSTSRGVLGYGVSTGAAGSMMVRGVGSGARLLVLIDGQPQYAGLMGHPIPDVYQTLMTEKVEVLRGPASLLYGSNAMGGVVNIVTRQMNEDGCKTNISLQGGSYGTFQADAVNRFRMGKLSTIVGAQYKRTDGHRSNSAFEQFGGYAKIGYDFSDHWKAVADANVTHFNASNPGPDYAPLLDNDSKITRGLASVSLSNSFERTNGTLRLYCDWGHHNIDDGYEVGGTPRPSLYKHDDYIAGISWYQSAHFFAGNTVTVGLDWQHFGGSAWNASKQTGVKTYLVKDKDGNLVENQHADEVGTYIDFRQDICKWLTVDAGLRVDWHSVIGTELVPQGGLAFHPTRNADIKALVSKGFRNPIIKDMYMFPPATTDLKPESMMNYELAYTQRIGRKARIGANIFYIKGKNLINTVRIDGRPRNVNTGDFENWGLELSGDYRINRHWSVDGNYSYLRMETPIIGAPEGKLYLGGKYHNDKWTATAGVQNISGLYIAADQKENYTLLNATVSYKVLPWMALFAKGENLLAEQYQTYDGFYMPKATFMGGVTLDF